MLGSQSVKWDGKKLQYEDTGTHKTNRTINPTSKQWKQFWTAADKVHLWKCNAYYDHTGISDGWFWQIEIEHGKTKMKSFGRNACPDDTDVTKTSEESLPNMTFSSFRSALEALIGFKL